ncbi:MAG: hypothetical protein WC887_01295 [Candidatus Paceibacterota bacterium]
MNRTQTIPSSDGTKKDAEKPKTTPKLAISTPVRSRDMAPGRFTERSLPPCDRNDAD